MEKEGMVRCTECSKTFANLRNLKRHQNQKHKEDVKVRKCPIEGCGTFSFRMEYLASHLRRSHGKTVEEAKETARRTPVEVRKRSEINSRKNEQKQKKITEINNNCEENVEDLLEISVNENEQSTIDCDFNLDFLDEYLHNLEEDLQTQEEKEDEIQSSPIPMAVEEEDEEEPCMTEMEESQPQEPHVIETIETITLNLVTTKRTVNGVTSVKREHNISTSMHYRPEEIDWTHFFQYLQDEFVEHARARHEREDQEAEYL